MNNPNHQKDKQKGKHYDEFGEPKTSIAEQLGNFSDAVIEFAFSPHTIKFFILAFASVCTVINVAGYCDLWAKALTVSLNEYGQELPLGAPVGDRVISSIARLPLLGDLIVWLDKIVGGYLAVLVIAILTWAIIQAIEIGGNFFIYFPNTLNILLIKVNRTKYEDPRNRPARQIHKMATGSIGRWLRWLFIIKIVGYIADIYGMHLARPWIDILGNPLWLNWFWNTLAVFGVEICLLLHLTFKNLTLTESEKEEQNL